MRKLFIAGLRIEGQGFRLFKNQNIENFAKEGLTVVNGQSGTGKTSLIEILRLAIEGKNSARDTNLLPDDSEESEIKIPIAEYDDPKKVFFIRAVVRANGDVKYSFQVEDEKGKLKGTDHPIEGMEKLTVSKMQEMMNTTLTYGIDNFLSEDSIKVRDFIYKTFYDELMKLNLVVDKKDPNYGESINGKIEFALAERDEASRVQSKLGAYNVNLEGLTKPNRIDMAKFEKIKTELTQQLADLKATHKSKAENKQQRIDTLKAEAENIKLQADSVKRDIAEYNNKLKAELAEKDKRMEAWIEQAQEHAFAYDEISQFFAFETILEAEHKEAHKWILEAIKSAQENLKSRPEPNLIPIDIKEQIDYQLEGNALALFNNLADLRAKYVEAVSKTNKLVDQEDVQALDTSEIDTLFTNLNADIEKANEQNELADKFDALDAHQRADEKVKEFYKERNRLFMQINCGVKGLSILTLDDDGKRLGFFYNGESDVEYFQNPNKEPRPITSYSKSQKIFIAAMLQCYLMAQKNFPINVLFIDDTGMDNKVRNLWDKFARKYGLMLFVTSTNDRTIKDLAPNEILIEDGEILVKE